MSTYGKTASSDGTPSGLYEGLIASIDGDDVYITVPRLSNDFVHGPIMYTGTPGAVGDKILVGFLEGNRDNVVAIFPGGAGGASGPIEVPRLVASSEAPQWIKDVADYVCTGVNDEVQVRAAVDETATGIEVYLSGGTFYFDDHLYFSGKRIWLTGTGMLDTYILVTAGVASGQQGAIQSGVYIQLQNLAVEYGDNNNAANRPDALISGETWQWTTIDNVFLESSEEGMRLISGGYATVRNSELYGYGTLVHARSFATVHDSTLYLNQYSLATPLYAIDCGSNNTQVVANYIDGGGIRFIEYGTRLIPLLVTDNVIYTSLTPFLYVGPTAYSTVFFERNYCFMDDSWGASQTVPEVNYPEGGVVYNNSPDGIFVKDNTFWIGQTYDSDYATPIVKVDATYLFGLQISRNTFGSAPGTSIDLHRYYSANHYWYNVQIDNNLFLSYGDHGDFTSQHPAISYIVDPDVLWYEYKGETEHNSITGNMFWLQSAQPVTGAREIVITNVQNFAIRDNIIRTT